MIYLDSAATSLLRPKAVSTAVKKSIKRHAGYARSGHRAAIEAAKSVYDCRALAARFFNVEKSENVVFCLNASHALNIAISGLSPEKGKIMISGYEHNSVWRPAIHTGCEVIIAESLPFDAESAYLAFKKELEKGGVGLAVCTRVSNVFGNILPTREIGCMCREHGVPFIIDASQAAGSLEVDAQKENADVICIPGHKGLMGPTGTGLMLLCSNRLPKPFIYGGTGTNSENSFMPEFPPERFEGGTPNIAGIAGLSEGLRYVLANREAIELHERRCCDYLKKGLSSLPNIKIYAPKGGEENAGLFSFKAEGQDCENFAAALAKRDIAVRAGLHCAPLAHRSMGTLSTGTIRVSTCAFTTLRECDVFIGAVEQLINTKKRK